MERLPNIIATTIAMVAGISVLSLAVPATMAAFTLLPTAHTWEKVINRSDVPKVGLLKLHASQRAAVDWVPSGKSHADRAVTEIALAKAAPSRSVERADWYQRAEGSVEEGLLLAPAAPYAWARLAYLRIKNGGWKSGVREALSMSFLTGPYEKRLATIRIQYAIRLWNQLSPEDRAFVKKQILWVDRKINRGALIKMAKRGRKSRTIIFSALRKDLDHLKSFKRALKR